MSCNRRQFIQSTGFLATETLATGTLVAGTLVAGTLVSGLVSPAAAAAPKSPPLCGADLLSRMQWLNPPAVWNANGPVLRVRATAKTDFWRKTFTDTISDNAPFFHAGALGEFTFQARAFGKCATQFDQFGIMVRFDERNWMKCGTEFFEGHRQSSVVVTRDYSDWSTAKDFSDSGPVWWRVSRHAASLEIYASADGSTFTLVRSAFFPPSNETQVGIYCAAPEGAGFDCTFDQLSLSF